MVWINVGRNTMCLQTLPTKGKLDQIFHKMFFLAAGKNVVFIGLSVNIESDTSIHWVLQVLDEDVDSCSTLTLYETAIS
jgi:hypothetical protein